MSYNSCAARAERLFRCSATRATTDFARREVIVKPMPLAFALTLMLAGCAHITAQKRAAAEATRCFPQRAPSPADSVACVRVAVDALEREIGAGYAYVSQFRETADSVLVLLSGGPSPLWVGG